MSWNLSDVITVIENAINGNSAINAHCLTTFGKIPTIFIGIDPRKPPKFEESCPVIAVWTGGRARSQDQSHRMHTVSIGCGIKDTTQTRTGQSIRFKGLEKIDTFANMVEEAVVKAMNAAGFATSQEPSHEDENIDSFFKATWTFIIRCPSRL